MRCRFLPRLSSLTTAVTARHAVVPHHRCHPEAQRGISSSLPAPTMRNTERPRQKAPAIRPDGGGRPWRADSSPVLRPGTARRNSLRAQARSVQTVAASMMLKRADARRPRTSAPRRFPQAGWRVPSRAWSGGGRAKKMQRPSSRPTANATVLPSTFKRTAMWFAARRHLEKRSLDLSVLVPVEQEQDRNEPRY